MPHLYSKGKKSKRTRYIIPTEYLSVKEVLQLREAAKIAYNKQAPLNRFMTFHIDPIANRSKPNQFIIDLMQHTRKWLQQRGHPVAYLYVLENSPIKGIHVHLLIHIPNKEQNNYKRALKRWLPFDLKKPEFDTQTITYPYRGGLHKKSRIHGIIKYLSKGLDPSTPLESIKPRYQGKIKGKRWGISKSLRE